MTYPLIACSSNVPRLVLVVVPHVPASSPVVMRVSARFGLYVAIYLTRFL